MPSRVSQHRGGAHALQPSVINTYKERTGRGRNEIAQQPTRCTVNICCREFSHVVSSACSSFCSGGRGSKRLVAEAHMVGAEVLSRS